MKIKGLLPNFNAKLNTPLAQGIICPGKYFMWNDAI
jgi:hypothetical protein